MIASGLSPRDLIAHKRKAPEERRRFVDSDCVVQIYPTLRLGFTGLVIHSQPEPRGASPMALGLDFVSQRRQASGVVFKLFNQRVLNFWSSF